MTAKPIDATSYAGPAPAIRTQADGKGDAESERTATPGGGELITRQEGKDEADINVLLSRFGVMQQQREPTYGGIVDENLDLTAAMGAIEAARKANYNVPPELQEKYPDWKALLNGVESGEYQKDIADLNNRRKADNDALEQAKSQQAELRKAKLRKWADTVAGTVVPEPPKE